MTPTRHKAPASKTGIASRVDASRLTAAFTTLLVAVAIYTLCRSVPGLA